MCTTLFTNEYLEKSDCVDSMISDNLLHTDTDTDTDNSLF